MNMKRMIFFIGDFFLRFLFLFIDTPFPTFYNMLEEKKIKLEKCKERFIIEKKERR